jgi:hypothetical protein
LSGIRYRKIKNGALGHNELFPKRSTLPPQRKFLPSREEGKENWFLLFVSVLGHTGVNFQFPRGGMDDFWNEPMQQHAGYFIL